MDLDPANEPVACYHEHGVASLALLFQSLHEIIILFTSTKHYHHHHHHHHHDPRIYATPPSFESSFCPSLFTKKSTLEYVKDTYSVLSSQNMCIFYIVHSGYWSNIKCMYHGKASIQCIYRIQKKKGWHFICVWKTLFSMASMTTVHHHSIHGLYHHHMGMLHILLCPTMAKVWGEVTILSHLHKRRIMLVF